MGEDAADNVNGVRRDLGFRVKENIIAGFLNLNITAMHEGPEQLRAGHVVYFHAHGHLGKPQGAAAQKIRNLPGDEQVGALGLGRSKRAV